MMISAERCAKRDEYVVVNCASRRAEKLRRSWVVYRNAEIFVDDLEW